MALSIDNLYSSMMNSGSGISTANNLLSSSGSLSGLAETGDLQNSIENAQTDEEMMNACKEFEAYFLEQIFKGMKSTVQKDEEEGEYMSMFSDMLPKEYANATVKGQGIGLASMLYESMKNNAVAQARMTSADKTSE